MAAGADHLAQRAAHETARLVELMPQDLRDAPNIPALTELPKRKDCEELLKELTRGLPLRMLLDRSDGSFCVCLPTLDEILQIKDEQRYQSQSGVNTA